MRIAGGGSAGFGRTARTLLKDLGERLSPTRSGQGIVLHCGSCIAPHWASRREWLGGRCVGNDFGAIPIS